MLNQCARTVGSKVKIDVSVLVPILRSLLQRKDVEELDWYILYLCELAANSMQKDFYGATASAATLDQYRFITSLAWDMVVRIGNQVRAEAAESGKKLSMVQSMRRYIQGEEAPEAYFDELERKTADELERVAARLAGLQHVESRNYSLREY
jgi:hypothetical protein